ncbi:hypothetical protein ACLOJK_041156 [Asimina triloba]
MKFLSQKSLAHSKLPAATSQEDYLKILQEIQSQLSPTPAPKSPVKLEQPCAPKTPTKSQPQAKSSNSPETPDFAQPNEDVCLRLPDADRPIRAGLIGVVHFKWEREASEARDDGTSLRPVPTACSCRATLGDEWRRKSFAVDVMASCAAAARRKGKSSSPRGRRRIALPSPSSTSRPLPLRQVTIGKVSHLPASSLSLLVSILLCSARLPPLAPPLSSARPASLRLPPPCPAPYSPSSLPPLAPPPSLSDLAVSASLRPVPPPAPPLLFLRSTRLSPPLASPPSALPPPPSSLSRPLLPLLSSSARPASLLPVSPPATTAMEEALIRILNPRHSIDILSDVHML